MNDNHGLTIDDLESMQLDLLERAMQLGWECDQMEYTREKVELALEIIDVLSAAYSLSMWVARIEQEL